MKENNRVFKAFRIQNQYLDLMQEIIEKQNKSSEFIRSGFVTNERIVIEEAIQFYHQHVFGTDVVSPSSEKIVERVGNIVEMQLTSFVMKLAEYFNAVLLNEETILEMIPFVLRYLDFDFEKFNEQDDPHFEIPLSQHKPFVESLRDAIAFRESENDR